MLNGHGCHRDETGCQCQSDTCQNQHEAGDYTYDPATIQRRWRQVLSERPGTAALEDAQGECPHGPGGSEEYTAAFFLKDS